jgi:hypothetical protein
LIVKREGNYDTPKSRKSAMRLIVTSADGNAAALRLSVLFEARQSSAGLSVARSRHLHSNLFPVVDQRG